MTLQVIGAGLGRTGTLTLKTALEMLGFSPCHHMLEVIAKPEQRPFWSRAAKGEAVDWEEVFGAYRASVDWPSCHFYKALAARYPDAKVILTVRDPKRWFDSMTKTILQTLQTIPPDVDPSQPSFARLIISQQTFGDDFSEASVIGAYERHNAEVRRSIPPERLLVFEPEQGWEPLCRFLATPPPSKPFPKTNSQEEFWARLPAQGQRP